MSELRGLSSVSNPFAPGPSVSWLGRPIQNAFNEVIRLVRLRAPVIVVIGGVGSGKTLLLDLLENACTKRGLRVRRIERGDLVSGAQGNKADLILVDEADALGNGDLQLLVGKRAEFATTMVLTGVHLSAANLPRAARSSVFLLSPLDPNDARDYVLERARSVGRPDLFTPDALKLLVNAAGGSPRQLRAIGSAAFFFAHHENAEHIGASHVGQALDGLLLGATGSDAHPLSVADIQPALALPLVEDRGWHGNALRVLSLRGVLPAATTVGIAASLLLTVFATSFTPLLRKVEQVALASAPVLLLTQQSEPALTVVGDNASDKRPLRPVRAHIARVAADPVPVRSDPEPLQPFDQRWFQERTAGLRSGFAPAALVRTVSVTSSMSMDVAPLRMDEILMMSGFTVDNPVDASLAKEIATRLRLRSQAAGIADKERRGSKAGPDPDTGEGTSPQSGRPIAEQSAQLTGNPRLQPDGTAPSASFATTLVATSSSLDASTAGDTFLRNAAANAVSPAISESVRAFSGTPTDGAALSTRLGKDVFAQANRSKDVAGNAVRLAAIEPAATGATAFAETQAAKIAQDAARSAAAQIRGAAESLGEAQTAKDAAEAARAAKAAADAAKAAKDAADQAQAAKDAADQAKAAKDAADQAQAAKDAADQAKAAKDAADAAKAAKDAADQAQAAKDAADQAKAAKDAADAAKAAKDAADQAQAAKDAAQQAKAAKDVADAAKAAKDAADQAQAAKDAAEQAKAAKDAADAAKAAKDAADQAQAAKDAAQQAKAAKDAADAAKAAKDAAGQAQAAKDAADQAKAAKDAADAAKAAKDAADQAKAAKDAADAAKAAKDAADQAQAAKDAAEQAKAARDALKAAQEAAKLGRRG